MGEVDNSQFQIRQAFPAPYLQTAPVGDLTLWYKNGEHQNVWKGICALPAQGGDLAIEIAEVADETMKRVAYNLDLLAGRLNVSGGGGYAIYMPQWCADPYLEHTPSRLSFTDYLREACKCAGFPGLKRYPNANGIGKLIASLGAGLKLF